ncbi:MAG: hypothetical protein GXO22_02400 [Aquificae bacterium]|nr:hypothetical protein [Aquificota bacterium]
MKRLNIKILLLIGIVFSTFHDYVFYNIDPCMSELSFVIEFEKGNSNDPLCDIHHELHTPVTTGFDTVSVVELEDRFDLFYIKPMNLPQPKEIFKPPRQLV